MHNLFTVEVPNRHNDLSGVEFDNIFAQSLLIFEDLIELASFDKWHNEIKPRWGLEQVIHSYQEWMVTTEQNIFLELRVLDLVIFDEHIFPDYLDSEELLFLDQFS
jgi:hypothetical protein